MSSVQYIAQIKKSIWIKEECPGTGRGFGYRESVSIQRVLPDMGRTVVRTDFVSDTIIFLDCNHVDISLHLSAVIVRLLISSFVLCPT